MKRKGDLKERKEKIFGLKESQFEKRAEMKRYFNLKENRWFQKERPHIEII